MGKPYLSWSYAPYENHRSIRTTIKATQKKTALFAVKLATMPKGIVIPLKNGLQ
jgi:hypothetical protein